jgi:hypothetical protein
VEVQHRATSDAQHHRREERPDDGGVGGSPMVVRNNVDYSSITTYLWCKWRQVDDTQLHRESAAAPGKCNIVQHRKGQTGNGRLRICSEIMIYLS